MRFSAHESRLPAGWTDWHACQRRSLRERPSARLHQYKYIYIPNSIPLRPTAPMKVTRRSAKRLTHLQHFYVFMLGVCVCACDKHLWYLRVRMCSHPPAQSCVICDGVRSHDILYIEVVHGLHSVMLYTRALTHSRTRHIYCAAHLKDTFRRLRNYVCAYPVGGIGEPPTHVHKHAPASQRASVKK